MGPTVAAPEAAASASTDDDDDDYSDDDGGRYPSTASLIAMAAAVSAVSFGAGFVLEPVPEDPSVIPSDHFPAPKPAVAEAVVDGDGSVSAGGRHPAASGVVRERRANYGEPSHEDLVRDLIFANESADAKDTSQQPRQPYEQHLVLDLKHLDSAFLSSPDRLGRAAYTAARSAGLTPMSFHCHPVPADGTSGPGLTCLGSMLEGHISLHTWSEEGAMLLDVVAESPRRLLDSLAEFQEGFGVARPKRDDPDERDEVVTLWSYDRRGPLRRPGDGGFDDQSDLEHMVYRFSDLSVKREVSSVVTRYHSVDIWDLMDVDDTPTQADVLRAGLEAGDPRLLTNEICTPERMLFLDGTMQPPSQSERECYEALVHPAMFATYPPPRHVAIVSGGHGAALREVLKHSTVERAAMVEPDGELIEIVAENVPQLYDCSDLRGSNSSCLDDPRVEMIREDGRLWFADRFGRGAPEGAAEKFDVIVLDSLESTDDAAADEDYVAGLLNALSPEGVIAIKVGVAPNINDPKADAGVHAGRERAFNLFESNDMTAAMLVYEEAHCGFQEPHSFLLVCRSPSCRRRWYSDTDAVDFAIFERILPTKSGKPAMANYDGATQSNYGIPPRAWEAVYCRREPQPSECTFLGLDLSRKMFDLAGWDEDGAEDASGSGLEVRIVKDEDGTNRTGMFATEDIPEGSYIMPGHLAASFEVSDEALANLRFNADVVGTDQAEAIRSFLSFVERHGHHSVAEGSGTVFVEAGGTALTRRSADPTVANVGRWMPPAGGHPGRLPPYSPVYERHRGSFDVFLVASRDIAEGEEVVKPEGLWD